MTVKLKNKIEAKSGACLQRTAGSQKLSPMMKISKNFQSYGNSGGGTNSYEFAIMEARNGIEDHPASTGTIHPKDFQKAMHLGPLGPINWYPDEMLSPVATEPTQ